MSSISDLLTQSIYPVLIEHHMDTGIVVRYEGSGFFVNSGGQNWFITAKHVGIQPGRQDIDRLLLPSGFQSNNFRMTHVLGSIVIDAAHDLMGISLSQESMASLASPPIPLQLGAERLEPFDDIFCFGYPFTDVFPADDPATGNPSTFLDINPLFVRGHVTRRFMRGRLAEMIPGCFPENYLVSFPIYPGLSGAPVLVRTGDCFVVAGVAYGNRKTSFFRGPLEVDEDQQASTRREVWAQYDFGIASTHEPILRLMQNGAVTLAKEGT